MQITKIPLSAYNKTWVPVLETLTTNSNINTNTIYKSLGIKYIGVIEEQHCFVVINYKKWIFSKVKHGL
jgi:hypothetical protein